MACHMMQSDASSVYPLGNKFQWNYNQSMTCFFWEYEFLKSSSVVGGHICSGFNRLIVFIPTPATSMSLFTCQIKLYWTCQHWRFVGFNSQLIFRLGLLNFNLYHNGCFKHRNKLYGVFRCVSYDYHILFIYNDFNLRMATLNVSSSAMKS